MLRFASIPLIAFSLCACGDAALGETGAASTSSSSGADGGPLHCDPSMPPTRTISCVDAFDPGPGAGFGQEYYPSIIYGDPKGAGDHQGSLDVLSLGMGGEIIVGFGGNAIVDGDGVDFIVFENAFLANGSSDHVFADLAEVSVSEDGVTWTAFPCETTTAPYSECGGWHPVFANDATGISPFDPKVAGGDQYDLKTIGVTKARLIRIRDRGQNSAGNSAGFDLDAAAIINEADPAAD